MRWHIVKTLLHKELLRHLANRGGLFLIGLLIGAALLLSLFGQGEAQAVGGVGGVQRCYVDYDEWDEHLDYLSEHRPDDLRGRIVFRPLSAAPKEDGHVLYPASTGGIQVRKADGGRRVEVWHPGPEAGPMAPYEAWFWQETRAFEQGRAGGGPKIEQERHAIPGGVDTRSGIATSLVWFGLFFVCVYLMPSLTAEEREKGVLLAQALSPATPREILGAKFLFYPVLALALAVTVAGTYSPAVLAVPFFWLALLVAVAGVMGIGLALASVAKTQRAASMGAMCYLMAVTLVLFVCERAGVRMVPYLALEYHCPRMIHAALGDSVQPYHWGSLAGAAGLSAAWTCVAAVLFRRVGWQS